MPGSVAAFRFEPVLDGDAVAELSRRLATRRPDLMEGSWELGVPSGWLDNLLDEWAARDSHSLQQRIDELEHWSVDVGGQHVHVARVIGAGPDPFPLVLTNGWPSSFLEHLELAAHLSDPSSHGGNPADAFTVVLPSLPGYGWSSPPPVGGMSALAVADLWRDLMVEGLGYRRFAAHGSDLGAGVTTWLARRHEEVVSAIHLATPSLPAPPPPWTTAEQAYLDEVAGWTAEEGGYAHQHSTKPATLAAALLDSPVGLAAWIGEKFVSWSSPGIDGTPGFLAGLLLDTLTLYWCTGTIGTSMLPYWRYRHDSSAVLPADNHSHVPTAISLFGGERVPFPKPPRELAERFFHLSAWQVEDSGGHFPAASVPGRLASILRDAFRPYR